MSGTNTCKEHLLQNEKKQNIKNIDTVFNPASSPEQFLKNSLGATWFRRKFLFDLIRQL